MRIGESPYRFAMRPATVPDTEDARGMNEPRPATYRDAGVDIDAATRAVDRIKAHAHSTFATSAAAAPIGHFGGVYRLAGGADRLLVASADGIGTKLMIAFVLDGEAHARVGADLVNHCVNDILACGARPLFFLDYVAMGRLDGAVLESLVAGMASACRDNGLALIGGETAEMPGLYQPGHYDAAGFIVGEVEPARFIDGRAVQAGDVLIGLPGRRSAHEWVQPSAAHLGPHRRSSARPADSRTGAARWRRGDDR
ncbi:MAG: hypothetical protein KatS3mg059_1118 [Thermomicrobiales bacterium]|nr:MAG: hypothetical protein KatS3mg059_1118 [Thermomicrobiales bacterium]